jgi:hypothetical protein
VSGRRSKQKGSRRELEFSRLIGGTKVPLSGALGGEFVGDVRGMGMVWEVKSRKAAWGQLYEWLDKVDALALKRDRSKWLVVMPLDKFMEGWKG